MFLRVVVFVFVRDEGGLVMRGGERWDWILELGKREFMEDGRRIEELEDREFNGVFGVEFGWREYEAETEVELGIFRSGFCLGGLVF